MNGNGAMSRGLSTYTELLACLAFARRNYEIAVPLPLGTAQIGWDLLVKLDGRDYHRIQVKAAKVRCGRVGVRTVKREKHNATDVKRPYDGHEFDFLLAVEADSGVMWLVPMAEVRGKRSVLLSGRPPWVGEEELPTLQEITRLSRLLKPRVIPEQAGFELFASHGDVA